MKRKGAGRKSGKPSKAKPKRGKQTAAQTKSKRGKVRTGNKGGGPSPSNPLKMRFKKRPSITAQRTALPKQRDPGRWIYGHHVVEESLGGSSRVHSVCVMQGQQSIYADIIERAKRKGVKIRFLTRNELDRLCESGAHQGLAANVSEREGKSLDNFIEGLSAAQKKAAIIVALDEIQDPHNFGAIARSANCFGASAIITTEFRSATISQTVLQTSAGAIQKIPSFRVLNLGQCLKKLKEEGFWIYGADGAGSPSWKVKLNRPMVLVIGAEGKGIRPLVKTYCDELVRIPQHKDGVASLNASCAASVLLYEATRQFKR